ncbi:diuretic hormone receptor [Phlebotomus argentipes]|uniref:diuretic hormone receptor n=1 Tax=Phlebotomus argentipes TaxID=94469 RepID=UPI002892D1AA|nr:diuretic hormone receptor [Phlebotomus argentipes]
MAQTPKSVHEFPPQVTVALLKENISLPEDILQAVNNSIELKCLIKSHLEELEEVSDLYCATVFDTILCWPRTKRGTWATLPCLKEFQGIRYDTRQNATRYCQLNGEWDNYTNYNQCHHVPVSSSMQEEFELSVELPTIIYYVGYTISLISLLLAVLIFVHFRDLRCLRNTIHANLFTSYIMSALLWMLTLSLQISSPQQGLTECIFLVTIFHYFSLTNFFWMLVEGFYLYVLVIESFSRDRLKFNAYAAIGWGAPALFVITWAVVKGIASNSHALQVAPNNKLEIDCTWMRESKIDYIFQVPACLVLLINCIFLSRIMWVLITKLRSATTVETRQYRKASKALLVLTPLLGITYLVVLAGPNDDGVAGYVFAIVRSLLLSTQGLSVSLLYCFLNFEVRLALRNRFARWKDQRNIQRSQANRQSLRYV